MQSKKFLFLARRAPSGGLQALEALDAALTAAAFDQSVRLLFLDDGVWQLKRGQQPTAGRNPAALYHSLELYDVATPPWVEEESLDERGLRPEDLLMPVDLVQRSQIAGLLRDCDVLLNL